MKTVIFFIAVITWCFCFSNAWAEEQWVPTAIHIATTISDGSLTIPDIVDVARANGIKAIVITDRDLMEWEYGLWPLRNIIKRRVEAGSAFKYGVDNYLKYIELESRRNTDLVIISGLESAPFYYWSGLPFSGSFKLMDWHKHMLVIGLEKTEDYKSLSVLANKAALRRNFRFVDILRFWPLLCFVCGVFLLRKKEFSYKDDNGRELGVVSKIWQNVGITLIVVSVVFLLNENPLSRIAYDQYSERAGVVPYQMLIDDVNRKGGMIFWAHPEAWNISERSGIKIITEAHTEDLWKTSDYTGFALFYEGFERVGSVGGDWDRILKDYCEGRRGTPVWAIAGLAFDHGTKEDLAKIMRDVQTFVFAKDLSRRSILDAMHQGRMYVARGNGPGGIILDRFVVKSDASGKAADIGQEVSLTDPPLVEIKGRSRGSNSSLVEVRLIRDGKVIETFKAATPFDIRYVDTTAPSGKTFYRLEIQNNSQLIVTNPVFVVKEK